MKRPEQKSLLLAGMAILLASLMIIGLMEQSNADQNIEGTSIRAMGHIRIREAPSLSAQRISYIPWGENAQVIGIDESGEWYQVNYNGLIGWSAKDWFQTVGAEAPALAPAVVVQPSDGNGSLQVRALDSIRIREQPSILAQRLGAVSWGDVVSVLAIDTSGKWYQIEYKGLVGWSAKDWFEVVNGDLQSVPTVEGALYLRSLANVRLRQDPNEESQILDTIYRGGHALVLGKTTDGAWYRVRYNSQEGWVSSQYMMIDTDYQPPMGGVNAAANVADASTLEIPVIEVAARPTAEPTIEATPEATIEATPQTSRMETAQQTTPPRVETVIEVELPPIPNGTVILQNTNSVVPIRMSPERSSGTLGVIRQGGRGVVMEQNGMWLRINHYGIVGWVRGDLFEVTSEILDPSTVETQLVITDDEVLPISAGVTVETLGVLVRILNNPTAQSDTIGTISRGTQTQVLAIDPSGAWYQINQNGVVGWVQATWFKPLK